MARRDRRPPDAGSGAANGRPDRRARPAGVPLINTYEVGRRRRLFWWGATIAFVFLSFALGSEWGWSHRARKQLPQGVVKTSPNVCPVPLMPIAGEFEAQSAIILNASYLLRRASDVFEDVVSAITENVHLICLVSNSGERATARASLDRLGLGSDTVTLLSYPLDSSWIRDYGPVFLSRENGSSLIADLRYNINAEKRTRGSRWFDDKIPEVFGGLFNLPVENLPLFLEGGNILSNGEGVCVTTRYGGFAMRDHVNSHEPVTEDDVRQVKRALAERLGVTFWVGLPVLPEEVTGHVDMFATFTAPDSVVVAQCDPAVNEVDARLLDTSAANLAKVTTSLGPLRVTRVPMPPRAKRGGYRSYTNVLYANGTLLVPSFEDVDPEIERYVFEMYTRLLPGWKITTIPVKSEFADVGYFHCMTKNIPAFAPLPDFSRARR